MIHAVHWIIEYADGSKEQISADEVEYREDGSIWLYNVTTPAGHVEKQEVALVGSKAYKSIRRA